MASSLGYFTGLRRAYETPPYTVVSRQPDNAVIKKIIYNIRPYKKLFFCQFEEREYEADTKWVCTKETYSASTYFPPRPLVYFFILKKRRFAIQLCLFCPSRCSGGSSGTSPATTSRVIYQKET